MFRRKFTAIPAPDHPLYVVGDIHGCADLTARLWDRIEADALPDAKAVFVGDYTDRGPDSRAALDLLMSIKAAHPETIFLRGNHEDMLLDFIGPRQMTEIWLRTGGSDTLHSFGIAGIDNNSTETELGVAAEQFRNALGPDRIAFLINTTLSVQSGNVFVAHSGADPHLPLDQQPDSALKWGRSDFRKTIRKDDIWVAHGHWAMREPSASDGRIATDTGAYYSGRLTAARILPGEISFLSTAE